MTASHSGPRICPSCLGFGRIDNLERDPDRPGCYSTFNMQCMNCAGTGKLETVDVSKVFDDFTGAVA